MWKNENRPGYKKTRFGWFPDTWQLFKISEIAYIAVGRDLEKDHFSLVQTERHIFPVYSNTVTQDGLYGFYDFEEYESNRLTIVGRGISLGTAFPRASGFGAIGRLLVITPNSKKLFDVRFLSEYVNHRLRIFNESGGIPQLPGESFAKYTVVLPSLPEQEAIAQVLECWDKAIRGYERKIEKKRNIKKGLMQRLFGQLKFGGDNRESHIREFVAEISVRNKQQAINRVLSVTNNRGFILPEEQFSRAVASSNLSNYKVIARGQYAYNPSRINVGSIARLDKWREGVLSPMYTVFEVKNSIVHSDFFLQWLSTDEASQRIKNSAQGSVRETVSFSDLGAIPFTIPPIDTQTKTISVLNAADAEIAALERKLAALREQKRFLLNNMVTGTIRLPQFVSSDAAKVTTGDSE